MVDEASLLADVDRQLHTVVATLGEPVAGVLDPIAGAGSRRRARLVLTLARHGDPTLAARGAAAVELLHLGTLVHDDIVDGSPVRRHASTLHTALGMAAALWAADALYAEALHLADAVTPAAGVALGHALRRIADSQILEALGVTTARYWEVVDGKTVSLFEASFALADESAGGALPASLRDAVCAYGRLFQYVDDLQDIGGESAALGKPTGQDAGNELHTLPAADLVVSPDAVRNRLRELSEPIERSARGTGWADHLVAMTDHLLVAAERALGRVPQP